MRNSDEARVLTYVRQASGEEIMVAINVSNRPFVGVVEIGSGALYNDVTPSVTEEPTKPLSVGLPGLTLDAWGYRIFRRELK